MESVRGHSTTSRIEIHRGELLHAKLELNHVTALAVEGNSSWRRVDLSQAVQEVLRCICGELPRLHTTSVCEALRCLRRSTRVKLDACFGGDGIQPFLRASSLAWFSGPRHMAASLRCTGHQTQPFAQLLNFAFAHRHFNTNPAHPTFPTRSASTREARGATNTTSDRKPFRQPPCYLRLK